MSAPCAEVQVLRRLPAPNTHAQRVRATRRLYRKYASGRRSVVQIVHALDALRAQNGGQEVCEMAEAALAAVTPVPTVLWLWLCRHARSLRVTTLCHMLRVAGQDARCSRLLERHKHKLTATPDGLVALAHECHNVEWGPAVARPAIAGLLARFPARGPRNHNVESQQQQQSTHA